MEIRWNQKRHDEAAAKRVAEQQEVQRGKALTILNREYVKWKRALTRRPNGATQQDIIQSLYGLQKIVGEKCILAGLKDWKDATLTIIEDKICQIIAASVSDRNEIREVVDGDGVPRVAKVSTREELEALPWVHQVTIWSGFVGFLRDFPYLIAIHHDGKAVPIATMSSEVGVLQYPTLQQYCASLAAAGQAGQTAKASSDASSKPPGASTTAP